MNNKIINQNEINLVKLIRIESSNDFWCLIDTLLDDERTSLNKTGKGFYNNRSQILDAYKDGNLYGLTTFCIADDIISFEQEDRLVAKFRNNDLVCKNALNGSSSDLLPCFCIKENDTAIILWVHTKIRRCGVGSKLIRSLNIKSAYNPLPESESFWKSLNIPEAKYNNKKRCFETKKK